MSTSHIALGLLAQNMSYFEIVPIWLTQPVVQNASSFLFSMFLINKGIIGELQYQQDFELDL